MNLAKSVAIAASILCGAAVGLPSPGNGIISGRITYTGTPPKSKGLDLSKEPDCAKLHSADALVSENLVTGPGNTLQNVVVYISAGEPDAPPAAAVSPAVFEERGCRYGPHVLAVRVGQDIKIYNRDPVTHNIHAAAKSNREWSKIQPPNTPPFLYGYDKEEFIPVKCNIHPWMQGYFVVLKTSHVSVTGEDGRFLLPELAPGHYTVTAWHESYGTRSREITIVGQEWQTVNFVFEGNP
jgi:plastocyanin